MLLCCFYAAPASFVSVLDKNQTLEESTEDINRKENVERHESGNTYTAEMLVRYCNVSC